MPSRTLTLILNGKSASRDDIRAAVTRLRAEGPSIDVFVTWEAGHAARFARELGGIGNSVIVAGGGDGTVNEVLGGLMAAPAPATMAILPLGTANDFATSAGIPIGDPYAALRLAATGASVPVDVGVMNGRYFLIWPAADSAPKSPPVPRSSSRTPSVAPPMPSWLCCWL